MQIVCIYSGVSSYTIKLDYIFNIFKSTLEELGVEVTVFDVSKLNIDFFSGTKVSIIETILNNIKNASGVIFATTAQRFAPNGAMQNFIEHMDSSLYGNILQDKACITILTSADKSEYMAGNYMNTLISSFGGIPMGMFIGENYLRNIETSLETTKMIERYAEDFYRSVKQNRKYFVATLFSYKDSENNLKETNFENQNKLNQNKNNDIYQNVSKAENEKRVRNLTGEQVANLYQKETEKSIYQGINNARNKQPIEKDLNQSSNINFNNVYGEKSNYNSLSNENKKYETNQSYSSIEQFNSAQEDDISEITKLLSSRYKDEAKKANDLNQYINNQSTGSLDNIAPSVSTLKQKTQSLYHYFQPHLSKGIDITMQIFITGKEKFEGFFSIRNGECIYKDGIYENPDVSIISDANIWEEVLNGKRTLQKAFMLGTLKVKGNFVLVSKFEQFFKIA